MSHASHSTNLPEPPRRRIWRPRAAAVVALVLGLVAGVGVIAGPAAADSTGAWSLYKAPYDSTIYELVNDQSPNALSYDRWVAEYGAEAPATPDIEYVKYAWSSTIYGVILWPGDQDSWQWTRLSYSQWVSAGRPTPEVVPWIKGSSYYQWPTSSEIFVQGEDGSLHKLSSAEWDAAGQPAFTVRANTGYEKLSWSDNIAYMSSVWCGAGAPISYEQWLAAGSPTPESVTRFPADQFYFASHIDPKRHVRVYTTDVTYAGPTMNRVITYPEWQAAGSPDPLLVAYSMPCVQPLPPAAPYAG